MDKNKFDIIFEDGPISRFYIYVLEKTGNLNSIIVPVKSLFFKRLYLYKNYLTNNNNALKFLKLNFEYCDFICQSMATILNLNKFELKKIYKFENCFKNKKVIYVKADKLDTYAVSKQINKSNNSVI